ncbi:MAG TPA: ATP-binding domain-containing protein [Geminicoccaceae bacterium]|nr:ATP-binding domain-containing protein [Geminicoccaceae bacterium]
MVSSSRYTSGSPRASTPPISGTPEPCSTSSGRAAQGSEDPAVVIPLVTQHDSMLPRNPVYTALTRGRRVVVV